MNSKEHKIQNWMKPVISSKIDIIKISANIFDVKIEAAYELVMQESSAGVEIRSEIKRKLGLK